MSEQDHNPGFSGMENNSFDEPQKAAENVTPGITAYIAQFDHERAIKMQALRRMLNELVPDMQEAISWGMPTFKYKGKNVFQFAHAKNHLGIYPGPVAVTAFAQELEGFVCTKASVHLGWDEPLPERLIRKMLRLNIDSAQKAK